jgi:hypothetical protein
MVGSSQQCFISTGLTMRSLSQSYMTLVSRVCAAMPLDSKMSSAAKRMRRGLILPSILLLNSPNAHPRLQSLVVREAFRADTNHPTGIANGPAAFEVARAPA